MGSDRFDEYSREKVHAALTARLPEYRTVKDEMSAVHDRAFVSLGNSWSRARFDGPFYRTATARDPDLPVLSLVFVQSRDGNTGTRNPSSLGGGATDTHLVYEGLSRVDADAVLSGARTACSRNLVFSVWHPELVALRQSLGRSRHPTQIILTESGDLPYDDGLMFQLPELRVMVVTAARSVTAVRRRLRTRPWVEVIGAGDPLSPRRAMRQIRLLGIEVISAVGGRHTATALMRERLVSDVYLTTSPRPGGEPNTPYYDGPPLDLLRVVDKAGTGEEEGVRFEHLCC
jgi:riboflavin biosynthesis pyrimidine reductase